MRIAVTGRLRSSHKCGYMYIQRTFDNAKKDDDTTLEHNEHSVGDLYRRAKAREKQHCLPSANPIVQISNLLRTST